jgi:hypothetical protein
VAGATLIGALNPNTTAAYTISSNNATVTNSGAVTGLGLSAFLAQSTGATLINNGSIFGNPTTAIVVDPGASLNIVNNGNVSGIDGTAINYIATSLGGAITQSGGTIQGGILLSGLSPSYSPS